MRERIVPVSQRGRLVSRSMLAKSRDHSGKARRDQVLLQIRKDLKPPSKACYCPGPSRSRGRPKMEGGGWEGMGRGRGAGAGRRALGDGPGRRGGEPRVLGGSATRAAGGAPAPQAVPASSSPSTPQAKEGCAGFELCFRFPFPLPTPGSSCGA